MTTSLVEFEEALMMWEYGKWARTAWERPLKMPGWVKEIKTLDREPDLGRIIGNIDDEYGERLDRKIAVLNQDGLINADILVNIYVNLMNVEQCAKDLKTTKHTVRDSRKTSLAILFGSMCKY